jgi:chemotaxis protein methyltransferase WspC
LAISLGAAGLTQGSVLIDAVDISARIIAHARRGIYSNFSLRAVDASFQQRYFQPLADGRYQLNPVWLDWPRWYQGNVVENAWHPPSAPYDVIFCRNVLIYLTLPMQRHLMRRLRQWLAPSGVLIVGHAEGQLACQFFRPIGEAHAFAFTPQPSSPGLTTQALSHHPQTSLAFELTPDITASVFSPPSPTAAPVTVQTWDPPAVVPTQAVASLDATPSLALAQRLADQGDWSAARTACVACLAVRPQAEGFFLLGLLAFVQKQGAEAEAHWHKAVYLSPDHAPTLRYLSLLKQQQGDLSQAQRWHRRWQRSMPA